MILSRVIKHAKEQNWTAVFIELAIVVLGVYPGLQAQEWSKQQEVRQLGTHLVADLLAEHDDLLYQALLDRIYASNKLPADKAAA